MIQRALLFEGSVYFISSSMMLLVNKLTMTYLPAPAFVTTLQYIVSAAAVYLLANILHVVDADTTLRWDVFKKYFWIPFLFSCAIFSNGKLLQYANVETFMVFRFSTPILVAIVDFALMGKALPSLRTWLSFLMITVGAIIYALTDAGFSLRTYVWAIGYLIVITAEMIVVKHIFTTVKMSNFTRVYLNNLLSLLFQPFFFFATHEEEKIQKMTITTQALGYLILSCILGIGLAWSGATLRAGVSATTFTVIGVACKVVTEIANWFMWEKHANDVGIFALTICLVGSTIFVASPSRTEQSIISNKVWNAMNACSCGYMKKLELESPTFEQNALHSDLKDIESTIPLKVEESDKKNVS